METINGFSIGEINFELQRVLSFSLFKNSPTLARFLEYVVTETINGRANCIKEYSIAIDVLTRPSNFNSHDDAVVRIHAGRLRRALNEYYLTEGINNLIFIDIPKGCYIPEFKQMEKAITQGAIFDPDPLPYTNTSPTVAIFPFKSTLQSEETDAFSLLLGEELSAELSRFQDISVIGYYSMETTAKIKQNVLEAGRLIGADYIITGSIQYDGQRIRVRVNLVITATGEVVITKSLTKEVSGTLIEIQDEIIQSAVNSVGGYYGSIFRKMGKVVPMKIPYNITSNLTRLRTITKRFGPLDRRLRS